MIVFGYNTYNLQTLTPQQLGATNLNHPDLRFAHRQKYFHLFFIPVFPLECYWAVKQGGTYYHPTPEVHAALQTVKAKNKNWLWAWTGPLLGIASFLLFSFSEKMEASSREERHKTNAAILGSFFKNNKETGPLSVKIAAINQLLDSSFRAGRTEPKKMDTSETNLAGLYIAAGLSRTDSLTDYTKENTLVVNLLSGYAGKPDVVSSDFKAAVESGNWKDNYSDTSSVFSEVRKLKVYRYVLLLKEQSHAAPLVMDGGYSSGYSLANAMLLNIDNGAVEKEFQLFATNSDQVSQYSFRRSDEAESSSTQLQKTLDRDLKNNILKQAYKYVFGKETVY